MNFWKRQAASRNLSGEHLCTINTSHSNDKLEIVFLETKRISISNPYDFEHQSHIGRDRDTSFGVEKLPPQWRTLLENERLRKLNSCSPKHLSFSSHSSTSTFSSVESDSSDTETTTDQEAVNLNGLCDYSDPKLVYKGWKKLAQGSTAIIYSTVNKINPSIRIAMKVLHCPQYKQTQQLVSEIKVLQFCKHKNIVSLIACHYYQNRLFLGMEFMDKGSVTDLIEKHQGILAENAISRILEQVLQGLVYIHQNDIIHRDLKSDNILINSNGDIKIGK